MSTAQPTMRMSPLFAASYPHHLHVYPSSPSSATPNSSYRWDPMPPLQTNIAERPRSKKTKKPPKTTNAPSDGGFTFITGNKPADFKARNTMTTVRRKAMDSFLKTEKSKDEELSSVMLDSQLITAHHADAPSLAVVPDRRRKKSTEKTSPVPARRATQATTGSSSSPPNQVATVQAPISSVTQPAVMIQPSRKGVELPFDVKVIPELRSFGKALDPFGTMFQSSHPQVPVENLKWHCSRYFGTYGLGKYWIPYCLDHAHTFLSTLCLAAAHHDVRQERTTEGLVTAALRQDIIMMVGENLLNPTESVADHNIIAVSQLIICEVISRSKADLSYHEKGMEAMIEKRGGLAKLGVQGRLASAVSWVNLASAVLREAEPRPMYLKFCLENSGITYESARTIPESPVFCPRGDFLTLQRSKKCSARTLELLQDMRTMVNLFLCDSKTARRSSQHIMILYKKITGEYPSAAQLSAGNVLKEWDWKYEAIRITAIVQAIAIAKQLPLSQSLVDAAVTMRRPSLLDTISVSSRSDESVFSTLENQQATPVTDYSTSPSFSMVSTSPGIDPSCFPFDAHSLAASSPQAPSPAQHAFLPPHSPSDMFSFRPRQPSKTRPTGPVALLRDLKEAIEKSNLSDCWSDMAGVLLWIGLVMGAASHNSESKVLSQYFSATTMRAGIMLCFDHPEAMHATMLTMTDVVQTLGRSSTTPADLTTTQTKKRRTVPPL